MAKKPVIALLYDFDHTLCTKDMQEYSFIPSIGLRPKDFWDESERLATQEKMDRILAYMYLMIRRSNACDRPIRRQDFVALGHNVEFYEGVPTWFDRINAYGKTREVAVEHYIISSGLKEIIEGTPLADKFREIYACEFHYNVSGIADWPKSVVNYTTKTQFLFRINKGVLDVSEDRALNEYQPDDERPVPFRNMIYIGDGMTDVPCMKLVKVNGGQSIAVYQPRKKETVQKLLASRRVDFIAPANYSAGGELEETVETIIDKMAVVDRLTEKHRGQMARISE